MRLPFAFAWLVMLRLPSAATPCGTPPTIPQQQPATTDCKAHVAIGFDSPLAEELRAERPDLRRPFTSVDRRGHSPSTALDWFRLDGKPIILFDANRQPHVDAAALSTITPVDVTRSLPVHTIAMLTAARTKLAKRDLARALVHADIIHTSVHGPSWLCLRSETVGADYVAVYAGVHTYATCVHWVGRFQLTLRVRRNGAIEISSVAEKDDLSTQQATFL